MHQEIILAGTGGQGIQSAGQVLAQVALEQGLDVSEVSQYSPEVRGGWVLSTVVVSDRRVGSPIVQMADCLLLMSQRAADDNKGRVRPGGLVLVNSSLVELPPIPEARVVAVPATEMAVELGVKQIANMVMLGAYCKCAGTLDIVYFDQALQTVLPERHHRHIPLNLQAVQAGVEVVIASGE